MATEKSSKCTKLHIPSASVLQLTAYYIFKKSTVTLYNPFLRLTYSRVSNHSASHHFLSELKKSLLSTDDMAVIFIQKKMFCLEAVVV